MWSIGCFLLLAFYVIITAQRGVQLEFKSRHFSPSSATIQHLCGMNFKITGIIGCCNLSWTSLLLAGITQTYPTYGRFLHSQGDTRLFEAWWNPLIKEEEQCCWVRKVHFYWLGWQTGPHGKKSTPYNPTGCCNMYQMAEWVSKTS